VVAPTRLHHIIITGPRGERGREEGVVGVLLTV